MLLRRLLTAQPLRMPPPHERRERMREMECDGLHMCGSDEGVHGHDTGDVSLSRSYCKHRRFIALAADTCSRSLKLLPPARRALAYVS